MKTKKLHFILIIAISLLAGYILGVSKVAFEWNHFAPKITILSKEPPAAESTLDMSLFWTVLSRIQEKYYNKKAIDSQKILNGAISGMVQSLDDPYTMYLPPVNNQNFKQDLSGQFQGIGAELGMKDNQIIVIAPLDGSPAQKAGIKAGDAIIKVDDQSTYNWTINQAVDKIRGPKGTTVRLGILHKGEKELKDIEIIRGAITVKSVQGWIKNVKDIDGINISSDIHIEVGYIRISEFGDNTNQNWQTLVNSLALKMNNDGKNIKGFILDLRNNPGGYLPSADFLASEFIDSGTVVIEDMGNNERETLSVNRKGLLTKVPVIVLINKGTASASEIVAGALRDHGRAKLLGETSFGKGIVQEAEDLPNGAGLHVTIAKWLTPNGTWVGNGKDGVGLKPDIQVSLDPKDPTHDLQLEKAVEELIK